MGLLDIFTHQNILEKVEKKDKYIRFIIYIICCFFVALAYNIFFTKNNIVIGGMSGLAIIVKNVFGISTGLFLIFATIILLIINTIVLGYESAKKNIVCAIIYPILATLTEPLTSSINIHFSSHLFTCIIAAVAYSIPVGIIFKVGYSTGGSDLISQIIVKYGKTSVGQASTYMNLIIICTSLFSLGIPISIYSIFALLISNTIVDFIVLGNSDSKFCIIKTKNIEYLEHYIQSYFNIGYSILNTSGGKDNKKRRTIMCVVTSREYFRFKNLILDVDPNAFFITHDCYEVLGGKQNKLIKI